LAVLVVGMIATLMAIFVTSIYGMFIMAADIIFVIMFPQLVTVLFIPKANTYGALLGFLAGFSLRFMAGEPYLALPALIYYPGYDSEMNEQRFPFRTFTVILTFFLITAASYLTSVVFRHIPLKYDIFDCFKHRQATFGFEVALTEDRDLAQDRVTDDTCTDLSNGTCTANK